MQNSPSETPSIAAAETSTQTVIESARARLQSLQGKAASPCRLTVAIPAYKPRFLEEALHSAVEQAFDDFEILVCDDCRSDAVARIVRPFMDRPGGPAVRYVRNEQQLFERGNFARCLELARGHYMKFLCDDDLLLPGALTAQAAVLDARPDVSVVASRRTLIDVEGHPLPDNASTRSPFRQDMVVQGQDLVSFLADHTLNFIGEPSGIMFRRAQLLPLGKDFMSLDGHPIAWLADLTMYVNLMRMGDLAMLQRPGARFRISTEQESHISRSTPGIGNQGYADFSRKIGELGWHRTSGNELVRIAPLGSPQDWVYVNMRTRLDDMVRGDVPVVSLDSWLAARAPSSAQMRLIEDRLAETISPDDGIHVVVRHLDGDAQKLAATVDSLRALPCLKPHVQISVITTRIDDVPPGVDGRAVTTAAQWPAAANELVASRPSGWIMVLDAGDIAVANGLCMLMLELPHASECRALYADELVRAESGHLGSLLRPDFNLDMLLSCPAGLSQHWLFRRSVFLQAGGFDPVYCEAPEFELQLRLVEAEGMQGLGHIGEPLLISEAPQLTSRAHEMAAIEKHLRARGYAEASVLAPLPGRYQIDYAIASAPLVSIIIPTKDQFAIVERCVGSLLEKTAYQNYEIILVDNHSTQPAACAWLDGLEAMNDPRIRVLRYTLPFNYSAINNMAALEARGDYLLLLNNDTAILRSDWLDALLNHARRPEVGIVGAKLLYPNNTIQHAGVVLGLRGPAEHPFNGVDALEAGYMHRLEVDQGYSAVTAACLMIRRSVYEEVGGLDEEAFKVSYNDVDLCLKVRQAGYLVVWTPHAVVLHEGSVSQNSVDTAAQEAKRQRFQAEQDAMYRKWLPIVAHDPAYNPNLSLHGTGFEVETDATVNRRPLPWRPQPVVLALAADHSGCGHYRVIEPVRAMHGSGIADARFAGRYFTPEELHRLRPDTLVLQRQVTEEQLQLIQRMKRIHPVFMVAELDDYLPNLPLKNTHRQEMPKDVLRQLRRSVGMMDRFVVSTDALAEALKGIHPDMRVVQNRLPPRWWRGLQSSRRTGGRLRVGWAGGISHQGDLELIADVVKELHREVDWIFFGMCPDRIKPYVREYHGPVPIERYPAMLANLNLDVALAPLEQNLFNECKSNLRLLEYGACGYPVIASDAQPYRCGLPVTLVKNRFKDWVDAIRAHVQDPEATARSGDALKAAVERDWMLEGAHLEGWLRAWLPD